MPFQRNFAVVGGAAILLVGVGASAQAPVDAEAVGPSPVRLTQVARPPGSGFGPPDPPKP